MEGQCMFKCLLLDLFYNVYSRCFWKKEKCNICNGEMDFFLDCWISIDVY